jgi:phenylpyruvate tautomerase
MPLLNITTSAEVRNADELCASLTPLLARALDKETSWVMVVVNPRATMTFGGSAAPACYAEVKNVGSLAPAEVEQLSKTLCAQLSKALDVPEERIYLEFTNVDGAMWGWNGSTFA